MLVAFAAAGTCLSSPAPPRPTIGTAPRLVCVPPLTSNGHRRPRRARLLRPLRAAPTTPPPAPSSRPARDRVIEFGKHKGQMLGTLPPSYLRWVAAELDYGDTAPWVNIFDIKLLKTDTTLDLGQKSRERYSLLWCSGSAYAGAEPTYTQELHWSPHEPSTNLRRKKERRRGGRRKKKR